MGPSEKDQLEMLKTIGFESLDELVTSTVPANIRLEEPMELGSHTSAAMSETEALALLRSMADKNQVLKSLIGQGYHETHTPYVILRNMLENPVRGAVSVKRHRRASSPGMMDVGGLIFDFECIRTRFGVSRARGSQDR